MSLYEQIVNEGAWVESKGEFSRYHTHGGEFTWVCELCEAVGVDPDEHICGDEDEDYS